MEIAGKTRTTLFRVGFAALLAALILSNYLWVKDRVTEDGMLISGMESPAPTLPASGLAAQTIVGKNLFGVPAAPLVPQAIPENLPETTLVLVLRGVAPSTDNAFSSAMIEKPDGKTVNVFVGSEIDAETSVHAIQSTQVVLKRRNQLEVLSFPVEQIQASAYERPARRTNTTATAGSRINNTASLSRPVAGTTTSTSTGVLLIREAPRPPTAAEQQQARDQEKLLERLNAIRNAGSNP